MTLTRRTGRVYRIKVGMKPPSDRRLKKGEFSASLPRGTYGISDRIAGGGSCGVYVTGRGFRISNPFMPVTSISIKSGRPTYVHINCFLH